MCGTPYLLAVPSTVAADGLRAMEAWLRDEIEYSERWLALYDYPTLSERDRRYYAYERGRLEVYRLLAEMMATVIKRAEADEEASDEPGLHQDAGDRRP